LKYISAHQPQFIPQLSFFAKIKVVDVYVCLDSLKYSRHSFQTRNKIKIDSMNGWCYLLVPVKKSPQGTNFDKLLIDYSQDWKKKHLKAIKLAYSNAKYFEEIFTDIEKIYKKNSIYLKDIVIDFIYYGIKSFDIKTEFLLVSDLIKEGFKTDNKKSLYVLDLIRYLKGTKFLFGKNYWKYFTVEDKRKFDQNNVEYKLQEFEFSQYPQLHGSFVPGLSFIDLLFNLGKEDSKKFLLNPWRFK
tara:strand:- start:224 stop:952 length:729 start_codon:yes stop_codon:yes gene_type:complete